jgi:hypothetical protein
MKKSNKALETELSEKLCQLEKENKRLRAELDRFKYDKTINDSITTRHREKSWQLSLRQGALKKDLFERKNFASYLFGTFKSRTFFLYYQKFIYLLRKYTFVTTTLKILLLLWTLLQSSALFVLFTGSFAIIAPITVLFSYIAIFLSFLGRKKLNRRMRQTLQGKKITVFYPPKGRAFEENSYFKSFVRSTASAEESAVVIVSPYYFDTKGISHSRRYYLSERLEAPNIILIRKHYFFTFKKHVLSLSDASGNITYIF